MKLFKIDIFNKTEIDVNLTENFYNTFADGTITINRKYCDWQNAKSMIKSLRFKEALEKLNIKIVHIHAVEAMNIISENWSWSIRWKPISGNGIGKICRINY